MLSIIDIYTCLNKVSDTEETVKLIESLVGILDTKIYTNETDIKSLNDKFDKFSVSINNGKNKLEQSIIEKGGTVSKISDVATFDELELGVLSISTDIVGFPDFEPSDFADPPLFTYSPCLVTETNEKRTNVCSKIVRTKDAFVLVECNVYIYDDASKTWLYSKYSPKLEITVVKGNLYESNSMDTYCLIANQGGVCRYVDIFVESVFSPNDDNGTMQPLPIDNNLED